MYSCRGRAFRKGWLPDYSSTLPHPPPPTPNFPLQTLPQQPPSPLGDRPVWPAVHPPLLHLRLPHPLTLTCHTSIFSPSHTLHLPHSTALLACCSDDSNPLPPGKQAVHLPPAPASKRIPLSPQSTGIASPSRAWCPPALSSQYPITRRLPVLGQSLPPKSRPHATPSLAALFFSCHPSIYYLFSDLSLSCGTSRPTCPLPALFRCWFIIGVNPLRPSTFDANIDIDGDGNPAESTQTNPLPFHHIDK